MANGVMISFLPALLLPLLGEIGFQSTTFGDADFGVIGLILGNLSLAINSTVLFTLAVLALLSIFIGVGWGISKKKKREEAEAA